MKLSRARYSFFQPLCWAIIASAIVLSGALSTPAASQQYQYGATCADCHAMPPIDSTYRNVTTGGFKGSHSTHNPPSVAPQAACEKCHSGSAGFTTSHMNDFVNMTTNINNSAHPSHGTYNKPRFFNLTSNPVMQSCANVNCHFEQTTPLWSSTQYSYPANCNSCHGAPPSGVASGYVGGDAGSHARHDTYYQGAANCGKCHPDYSSTAFSSHATSAGHANSATRVIMASGTYSGDGKNYLPSQAAVKTFGSCSSTYCHSLGTSLTPVSDPPNILPTWGGGPLDATCTGCHSGDNFATNKMGTGSHTKHVQTYAYNCAYCHSATVSDNRTISTATNHVNQLVEVQFNAWANASATYDGSTPKVKLPGSVAASCTNTYCHSNGTSVATSSIPSNTTPLNWGAGTLACNQCHGQGTYGDYRKGAPLYASGTPKGNAHQFHVTAVASPDGNEVLCSDCHYTTTTTNSTIGNSNKHVNKLYDLGAGQRPYNEGNMVGFMNATTNFNYSLSGGIGTCSNVSCHPMGLNQTTENWNNRYNCTDCHSVDMQNTSGYHHAMRNFSSAQLAAYPTTSPSGSSTNGTNYNSRRCTMCHVDHNIFSPRLNTTNNIGRAANLRTNITTSPNAAQAPGLASGYSNSDFINGAGGGLCISCHYQGKTKDTIRRRVEQPAAQQTTETPVIIFANYTGSAHQYPVPSKFMGDGSIFYGNCSKCHNTKFGEPTTFQNYTSQWQFGNHDSGIRRLQGNLGASAGETAEEQICVRCHSKTTDDDPGGGPAKLVAGMDWYGYAAMSAAAEDITTAILTTYRPSSATSTTTRLYFKPSSIETPSAPAPSAHNTGDTFAGGTWAGCSMSPWATNTPYETKSQATNLTGTKYWRMGTFTSPKVLATTTVPAGTWVINLYSKESSGRQNARIRSNIYTWTSGDALGQVIINKSTFASELATNAAPGQLRSIGIPVPSITLNMDDKIVVDLSVETTSSRTDSYTASFYFGKNAPSNLTLPSPVPFNYNDPGQAGNGHNVNLYSGIHKPSSTDETRGYIASYKHVECSDCHNVHATKNGNHTAGSTALAKVLTGASGVGVTTWGGNWAGVTTYNPATTTAPLITATVEWQICFKCHSDANANVSSWGGSGALALTNLGLEFNPNNKAGHPVVATLNDSGGRTVPKPLGSSAMKSPWTSVGTQTMTCADCHAGDSPAAKGPHGSSVKWLLSGANKAWPFTLASQNGGATGTTFKLGTYATNNGSSNGLFCLNCHTVRGSTLNAFHYNIGDSGGNHSSWASTTQGACVSCHIRIPHGGKVSRLIRPATAAVLGRYAPNGNGGEVDSQQVINSFTKPGTWGSSSSFGPVGGGCFCHSSGAETW